MTIKIMRNILSTLKANMAKESISFDFRVNKMDEIRNDLLEEIKQ